jgi:hypothetical protein
LIGADGVELEQQKTPLIALIGPPGNVSFDPVVGSYRKSPLIARKS